jgi:hypothetical protein
MIAIAITDCAIRPIKNQSNLCDVLTSSMGMMIATPKTPTGAKDRKAISERVFSPLTLLNKLLITLRSFPR